MEPPLSAAGAIVTQEHDSTVHLRRVEGNVLVLDPECGTAVEFRRIITPSEALMIRPDAWCQRCFPRVPE